MLVLMIGNIVQVVFWALLYRLLGAFADFETAMFSGVTSLRSAMVTFCCKAECGCSGRSGCQRSDDVRGHHGTLHLRYPAGHRQWIAVELGRT